MIQIDLSLKMFPDFSIQINSWIKWKTFDSNSTHDSTLSHAYDCLVAWEHGSDTAWWREHRLWVTNPAQATQYHLLNPKTNRHIASGLWLSRGPQICIVDMVAHLYASALQDCWTVSSTTVVDNCWTAFENKIRRQSGPTWPMESIVSVVFFCQSHFMWAIVLEAGSSNVQCSQIPAYNMVIRY